MADPTIFSVLKSKLDYVNQRQKLLSENVANADTPGYAPRDLKPFTLSWAMKHAGASKSVGLAQTDASHMTGPIDASRSDSAFNNSTGADSEVRIDGNQVVLEEQMSKLTQARIDYEAAVDFYQQTNSLLTAAAKSPGKVA
ncbi:MAG: flagellar basal body rod protein FlgB [Caulobacteraceae bacterium]